MASKTRSEQKVDKEKASNTKNKTSELKNGPEKQDELIKRLIVRGIESHQIGVKELRQLDSLIKSKIAIMRRKNKPLTVTLLSVRIGDTTFRLRQFPTGTYWQSYTSTNGKKRVRQVGADSQKLRKELGLPLEEANNS